MDVLDNWWSGELLIPFAKATCRFEPDHVLFSSRDDKYIMTTKICNRCKLELPISSFGMRKTTTETKYPTSRCRQCIYQTRKEGRTERGESPTGYDPRETVKRNARLKAQRAAGENRDSFLLADSRQSDKKKGLANDLDRPFIVEQIVKGCSYCGSHDHMTLDRIDNSIGHVKANVVPACYRCNIIRRDMPHVAWIALAPAIKAVADQGLFGDWHSKPFSRQI